MEWIGFLSLIIILCYSEYPKKVKRLEKKVKQLQMKEKGGNEMSKMIAELVGKKCTIMTSESIIQFTGATKLSCTVLEADEEWIKFSYTEKKGNTKIKIMRIDEIDGVELEE